MITLSAQIVLASFLSRGNGTKRSLQGKRVTFSAYQAAVWLFVFPVTDICISCEVFLTCACPHVVFITVHQILLLTCIKVVNGEAVQKCTFAEK